MKKSKIYLISLAAVLLIVIIWMVAGSGPDKETTVKVPVKFGKFDVTVTTTGELEAKSSEKINGPVNLRDFRIWQIKIEDIIPDGTVVDSGEYIATLDRTELVNKMKDQELEIEKLETQFTKTQLDTTLELRTNRDNLVNLKYALEEKQIVVDQSIYEPPATQRQAKIELERAQRNYEQAVENYEVKLRKSEADMQEINTSKKKVQSDYAKMVALLNEFTIFAPKSGMVIYRRGWDGQKQGIGSQISVWDPIVAELPNLKEMKSKTYVNEIDISKVKVNQEVRIGVDAFPDKKFTGTVTEVANIGQQLPNSNAKVFEVSIEVNEFDSILRPAMTTKNEVLTSSVDSVLFIPLDCVQSNDSMSYVYVGNSRKQVIPGLSNENEVIIRAGLEAGEEVYLVPPTDAEKSKLIRLDPEVIGKFRQESDKAH
ncbi:MAG: efflux RND transporter periplasmic adaptor subunit [Bacteroidales bacterium]|nr:efflux RND transporter periplasmic adaptor subunit [Bacteroidales bacterium]